MKDEKILFHGQSNMPPPISEPIFIVRELTRREKLILRIRLIWLEIRLWWIERKLNYDTWKWMRKY